MGKVIAGMTLSLDGFVNDRYGSVDRLYPDLEALGKTEMLQESIRTTGAVVMGRRAYEMGDPDEIADHYEYQTPIFVLTHHAPEKMPRENKRLSFTFVMDGIESAIAKAKQAAGEKDVTVIGGASTIQQCLQAGLCDELHVGFMPVLLGDGLRLFEKIDPARIKLERIKLFDSPPDRTDIILRVVR